MRIRTIKYLALILFLTACAQIQSINLPAGLTFLKGIDPSGLQYPIWSPNGKYIVASYVIYPMPDIAGFFGPEPRHDVVIFDTETWKTSTIVSEKEGNFVATAWFPDSEGFAMFWSDGPDGMGIYQFLIDDVNTTYFSESGTLSPDLEKIAFFDNSNIRVIDIHSQEAKEYKVPFQGYWFVSAWSPDAKKLTLVHQGNQKADFTDLYLLELDSNTFSQLTNDETYVYDSPIISPDGQLIAYTTWRFYENQIEDKLHISRLDHSCDWTLPLDNVDYFAWSPDGQRMFLVGGKGVYIADLNVLFANGFSTGDACP